MAIVIWWDAFGVPHQTEKMPVERAEAIASSMDDDQEAQVVYVKAGGAA